MDVVKQGIAVTSTRIVPFLALLASVACGTTSLSARGRQVVLLSEAPGPECAPLGTVAGSADPFFGSTQSDERLLESARNDALNQAARMGATHLRFTGSPERWVSGTFGGDKGVTVVGVAYRCGEPGASMAPTRVGCTKDTDCKGDRICEAGTCMDPKRPPSGAR